MSEPKGQILPGTYFGEMLTQCAKQAESIVEIGTWKGQGSTLCFRNGLIRPTQRILAFETDAECIKEAAAFHSGETRIRFIHGALSLAPGQPEALLYNAESLPSVIDLALIDGEEESGEGDMAALFPLTRIFALDDTRTKKNRLNRERLLQLRWHVIIDMPKDRNGWGIYARPTV